MVENNVDVYVKYLKKSQCLYDNENKPKYNKGIV